MDTEQKMALILETIVEAETIVPKTTKLHSQICMVLSEYYAEKPRPAITMEDEPIFDINQELTKNFGL